MATGIPAKIKIGEKYNKLTVLKDLGIIINNKRWVLCKCDCGTKKKIGYQEIKRRRTKSCGCLKNPPIKIGEKFGKITILKDLGMVKNLNAIKGRRLVLCKCDCGTKKKIGYDNIIKKGGTKSCGCLIIEKATTHGFFKLSYNERCKVDIQFKIINNLRNRLQFALNGKKKTGSAVRDLGCTVEELKVHLEKDFWVGMTWDNWGNDGWHIDHIVPLASFDLTDREQVKKACHYTNLQPLWAKDNHVKKDRFMNFYEFI